MTFTSIFCNWKICLKWKKYPQKIHVVCRSKTGQLHNVMKIFCPFSFFYLHLIKMNRKIVLFKSIRNYKRRNKWNFTFKSNSNKMMLFGGGRQHYLLMNKISTWWFNFLSLFTISKWIKQYFPRERLKKIYFLCQIIWR